MEHKETKTVTNKKLPPMKKNKSKTERKSKRVNPIEFLKQLSRKIQNKKKESKEEEKRISSIIEKNKENLGLNQVASKIFEEIEQRSPMSARPNSVNPLKPKKKITVNLKNCHSLNDWKRRNKVDQDKKVFICCSGYPDMRRAMLERGWVENVNINSPYFDYLCCLGGKDIQFESLNKEQIVNHFDNMGEVTRKVCLAKNLKNLIWYDDVNFNSFFPRCFDLSDASDVLNFIEEYKVTKAESVLKDKLEGRRVISDSLLQVAVKLIKNITRDINEVIDSKSESLNEFETGVLLEDINVISLIYNLYGNKGRTPKLNPISNKKSAGLALKQTVIEDIEIKILLDKLKQTNSQFSINGHKNIWIIKPSGLSRGRGIKCVDSISQVLQQVKSGSTQYIVQKYIENPLIILNRKFDVRQWVMVTSFNPLTIWLYDEPYIRFTAEKYNPEDLNNLYSHLTNNAIAKNSSLFTKSEIEGNMWTMEALASYLKQKFNTQEDLFRTKIQTQIKDIACYVFKSVQDLVTNRKNSYEIFGMDLMIDDQLNVWLIEVNSSPCMEYSTEITKRLVKMVMEDTCKVVIDKQENETGLWKLIHKGKYIEDTNVAAGFKLLCEGKRIDSLAEI